MMILGLMMYYYILYTIYIFQFVYTISDVARGVKTFLLTVLLKKMFVFY